MRLIDVDISDEAITNKIQEISANADVFLAVRKILASFPTVEAEPIIRCKDCKYFKHWYRDKGICSFWYEDGIDVFEDGFCSYGAKVDGKENEK